MSTNSNEPNGSMNSTTSSMHPRYAVFSEYFTQMRDTFAGEKVVKAKTTEYLPMTSGQRMDNVNGTDIYTDYLARSIYYDNVSDTVTDMLGLLHKEPTIFNLPSALGGMKTSATPEGESMATLLRRIHEEQLVPGRIGVLLDIPQGSRGASVVPQFLTYNAETILNWDIQNDTPRWFVLDEGGYELGDNLTWTWEKKYRMIALDGNDDYYTFVYEDWPAGFDFDDPSATVEATYPEISGKKLNGSLPFEVINAASILPDFEYPPLLSVSNLSLAVYRGEADYRQALFMQAQATMFLKGFQEEELANMRVGAGAAIKTSNDMAEASFIEVSGDGLEEMRQSQENLIEIVANLGVEMMDKTGVESGDAIITRLTVRTASLSAIADAAVAGLTKLLNISAEWVGANPDEVEVIAAKDFSDSLVSAEDINDMWAVVLQGGMTLQDYHGWLAQNDFTNKTYELWLAERDETIAEVAVPVTGL